MIARKNMIALIALSLSVYSFSQETSETIKNIPAEIIGQIGGVAMEKANSMVTDGYGNVISTGVFTESMAVNVMEEDEHDEHTVETPVTLTSKGMADGIITKYNYEDQLIWFVQLSATKFVNPEAIDVNRVGDIFVSGVFQGDFTYTVDGEEKILTSKGPDGDAFILALDKNGKIEWIRQFGGSDSRLSFSEMKIASNNAIFLTGKFAGRTNFTSSDKWLETRTGNLFSGGEETNAINGFLLKLNYAGDFEWVEKIGTDAYAIVSSLAIDNEENIYICGAFSGIVNLSDIDIQKAIGSVDSYLVKFNAEGDRLWIKYYGFDGETKMNSIVVNSEDQIVACGNFKSKVENVVGEDSNEIYDTAFIKMKTNGTTDGFVLCVNSKGELEWANHIQNDSDVFMQSIACTDEAYTVAVGYVSDNSQRNLYIKELNGAGDKLNDYTLHGGSIQPTKTVYSAETEATYILGEFSGKLMLNAKEYKSNGRSDIFILKVE